LAADQRFLGLFWSGNGSSVSGQREAFVWSGAQEFGADDGLELADLAGEEGVPDAELAWGDAGDLAGAVSLAGEVA
jgi:hypothetical protein